MKTTPTLTLLQDVEAALADIASVQGNEPQGREYWAERMNQRAQEALPSIQELVRRAGEGDIDKALTDAICSVTCGVTDMDDKITPLREAIKEAIRPHLAPVPCPTVDEDDVVMFIEKLQRLPISMKSNANQDYIEMGESIYNLAKAHLAPVASGWMPIEEYDREKHGERVLICETIGEEMPKPRYWVCEAIYHEDYGWYESNCHPTDYVDKKCNPTHWMPLPTAPQPPTKD